MTTPSTARKAGPFTGNGSQNSWAFTFKVFATSDVKVTVADAAGAETVLVLGTDYSVTLNSNQDTSPGGSVTYLLANGGKLTVTGDLDYDQPLDIPGGGNFNPVAFENQLDRMVMQTQQLAEEMGRAVKVPVTEEASGQLSTDLANGILALSPIADDIETVGANMALVENVSDNMADVNLVAVNMADVTNFADVYLGPKSTNPTTRNDGSPLQTGDLYFSTSVASMYVYGSGSWALAATPTPVTITPQSFSGNGSTTAFTLSVAPAFAAALDVYIGGVHQGLTADYTVSGTTLTFVSAPPSGTNNITVKILSAYASGVPSDNAITTSKLVDDAVTSAKIAAGAVGASELADAGVLKVLAAAYPVGSIYINAGVSTNPATLLGFGTWAAFGAGRVMVGLDGADTLFDTLEETGGNKNATAVQHTHSFSGTTSTQARVDMAIGYTGGTVTHPDITVGVTAIDNAYVQVGGSVTDVPAHSHTFSGTTASSGSSGTNANLQPYITVSMWKRTA